MKKAFHFFTVTICAMLLWITSAVAQTNADLDKMIAVKERDLWDEHPEWLWFDDFENISDLGDNYQDYSDNSNSFGVTDEDAFEGSRSLRQNYANGQVNGGWIVRYREEGFPSHLFMRWYHKYEEGFDGAPQKMARMRNRCHSTWTKPFGVYCWVEDGRIVAEIKATTSSQANSSGWLPKACSNFHVNAPENVGRWICFEMEVRLNDPGQQNGFCRIWADDELIVEKSGLDIRGNDDWTFNEVMLDGYWNDGSPKEQNRYFDNFIISTERIGPISTTQVGENDPDQGGKDSESDDGGSTPDSLQSGEDDPATGEDDAGMEDETSSPVGMGEDNWEDHPEWLWFDDFEDLSALGENYQDYSDNSNSFGVTDEDAFAGNKSLRQHYSSGQKNGGWIIRYREEGFPEHLFMRWYHKYEEGFDGAPQKMARMRNRSHSNWTKPFGVYCWVEDGRIVAEIKATTSSQANGSGWLPKAWSDFDVNAPENVGRWICFEMEVKLNDPGEQNGYCRIWADDELIVEKTGIDIRGDDDWTFNEVMLDGYWNDGSPKDQSRYFDNFVISTQRIGQMAAGDSDSTHLNPEPPSTSIAGGRITGASGKPGYSMKHAVVNGGIQFTVQLPQPDQINLNVYNLHGKKIWGHSKFGSTGVNTIDMKNSASGRYIVKLDLVNSGVKEAKMIKVY
ncbi:MAG: polysaccharide lyase [Chitinispirillaceae bacterium]